MQVVESVVRDTGTLFSCLNCSGWNDYISLLVRYDIFVLQYMERSSTIEPICNYLSRVFFFIDVPDFKN
jgi:hypothetical protein